MSEPLSIFLPMLNEEGNIEPIVESALEVAAKLSDVFEVIVVDDGSRDRTGEIARRLAAEHPELRVVSHAENRGYGAALRSGFAAARYPLVFFTDGDNQFDLRELPLLVERIDAAEIVSGYRIVRRDPPHRRLNSFLYNGLARLLFDIPVRDVNCAFKLYRRSLLERLELKSTGALINVELLARARKLGARVHEVGVHHFPRRVGAPTGAKPKVVLRAFLELIRLWRELR